MTAYVYMLSTYQENGAEDPIVTYNRQQVLNMFEYNYGVTKYQSYGKGDTERDKLIETNHQHELEKLALCLLKSDEELCQPDGHDLSDGWGGIMFHVVKVFE